MENNADKESIFLIKWKFTFTFWSRINKSYLRVKLVWCDVHIMIDWATEVGQPLAFSSPLQPTDGAACDILYIDYSMQQSILLYRKRLYAQYNADFPARK